MEETIRTTAIDSRRESYRGFFDSEWAEQLLASTKKSALWEPTVDLIRNWQAASHARAWPILVSAIAESNTRKGLEEIVPLSQQKIHIFRKKLIAKLKSAGETLRPMFWKKLDSVLTELDQEATAIMELAKQTTLDQLEDPWPGLVELRHFHEMVWSSERTCYGAVYYNYECFLKECVRIATRGAVTRVGPGFRKAFHAAFKDQLTSECWDDRPVLIARLTRTALVHNGGRFTDDLASQPHPFLDQGGEIQIGAPVTTDLFETLKPRVINLAIAAVSKPEFALLPTEKAES